MTGEIWPAFNQAICDVWGLNPNEVLQVTIDFQPHQMPTAYVTLKLNEGVMKVVSTMVPEGWEDDYTP